MGITNKSKIKMATDPIDSVEDIFDDQIVNEDMNLPRSLRRSIWLIEDEEDGNTYTADEILDDVSQDILFNIRTTLTAAYKSGKYKYICKECQQPLGLKIRTNEGDEFPFFSHYQNSDPCPRKSQIEIDPTYSARNFENAFQASSLYQMMLERLQATLCMGSSFENITISKLINSPEIKGYRKPAIYTIFQHKKEVCFDLLISDPKLGLLVGRNAFYKKHKMFYLWIFPSFTTHYQRICQKDILYMNRRNVFVFDSKDYYTHENKQFCRHNTNSANHIYAYEESIRQNRLMLNCYWQSPNVTEIDGKKQISIQWNGPELVAFEDLHFDVVSHEVYYHDSDVDFYNKYPAETQRLIDEWVGVKKDRWDKIFDSIERRKKLYEQLMQRRERNERLKYYYSLLETGEVEPTPFFDEKSKLYGYKIDDFDIIQPIYYEAKPFYCGYAWVRKKMKWGVIDLKNNRICNFLYSQVHGLKDGLFYAYKNQKFVLVNYKGEQLGSATFEKIELLKNGLFKICDISVIGYARGRNNKYNIKKERWGIVDYNGELLLPCIFDKIDGFENGKAKVYNGSVCGTINEFGKEEYEIIRRNDVIVYKSPLLNKYGLMDSNNQPLTKPIFSSIGDFSNGIAKVCDSYRYGIISESGNLIIPCEYEDTMVLPYRYFALKKDQKWTIANSEGDFITNQVYDQIGNYNDKTIYISQNRKWGIINYNGDILVPFHFDEIGEFFDGKAQIRIGYNIGYIDEQGNEIYNISTIDDGYLLYKSSLRCKYGIMTPNQEDITGLVFDNVHKIKFGEYKVKKDYKWGVIGTLGNILLPFEYDTIGDYENGFIKICKDGKWGIVNDSYQVVIPTKYDGIGDIKNGIVSVRKGKWWKKITLLKKTNKVDLSKLKEDTIYNATTTGFVKMGVFIEIPNIGVGLIPAKEIFSRNKTLKDFKRGTKVKVMVLKIDNDKKRASFRFVEKI